MLNKLDRSLVVDLFLLLRALIQSGIIMIYKKADMYCRNLVFVA